MWFHVLPSSSAGRYLCPPASSNGCGAKSSAMNASPGTNVPQGSKKAKVIQMPQRPDGATLESLMKATGWQAHSVRGFLSAAVGKNMGLQVNSSKTEDGQRVYRIG